MYTVAPLQPKLGFPLTTCPQCSEGVYLTPTLCAHVNQHKYEIMTMLVDDGKATISIAGKIIHKCRK